MVGCSYCANEDKEALLLCRFCLKYFCSSTLCTTKCHIVTHVLESGHNDWETVIDGEHVVCIICEKETNIFELGVDCSGSGKFRCRGGCAGSGSLNEDELSEWPPLVIGDQANAWVAAASNHVHDAMFVGAAEELEKAWKRDKDVKLQDVQRFRKRGSNNGGRSAERPVPKVVFSFESKECYDRFFRPLLERERATNLQDERRSLFSVASCSWDSVDSGPSANLQVPGNLRSASVGMEVKLSLEGAQYTSWSALGKITSIKPDGKYTAVQVFFDAPERSDFPTSFTSGYKLKLNAWNEVAFARKFTALSTLSQDRKLGWLSDLLIKKAASDSPEVALLPQSLAAKTNLNPSQLSALALAIGNRLALIQGPPGTGKSTVVHHLVKALTAEGKTLVCAPSNSATDDLATKLMTLGNLDVIRVYARSKEESGSHLAIALHNLCKAESREYRDAQRQLATLQKFGGKDSAEEMRRLRGVCRRIENQRLDKADVIVATCIGAGDERIWKRRFRSVIIDEATQIVEPGCLVAAVLSTYRVVLVGDHMQLGPTVLDSRAAAEGLDRSLFQRLVALRLPRVRLDIQYRMHPEIALFPSEAFYKGTLTNGVTAEERFYGTSFKPWLLNGARSPFFFWHVPSEEEWDSGGRSYINRLEALRIQELVNNLPNPADAGVITFYGGQRTLLAAALETAGCEVASVDSFQGREKEVIILSPVRANTNAKIGFLGEFRRLNVAVTRAKRALVICGNAGALRGDPTWLRLLTHLDERGAIFHGHSVNRLRPISLASTQ